ncbi:MAG: hypothetical protein P8M73_01255 [Luminiphilus sp.]|nr:hypothetical protein [Luminiphilus sp.]
MLFEYIVAAGVAILGVLGLLQLASEIVQLQTATYQFTVAGWVLEEWEALIVLAGEEGAPFSRLCRAGQGSPLLLHCSVLEVWLHALPDSHLQVISGGALRVEWQGVNGETMHLAKLWQQAPATIAVPKYPIAIVRQ